MKKLLFWVFLLSLAQAWDLRDLYIENNFWELKGVYYPRSVFVTDVKGANRLRNVEYLLNDSYGFALELGGTPLAGNRRWEVMTGVNYMHDRPIHKRTSEEKISGVTIYDEDTKQTGEIADEVRTIQITSIYLKSRWLFAEPQMRDSLVFFVGGQYAWNILKIRDRFEWAMYRGYENSFGYGLSCGWLWNNTWDIELAYNIFQSNLVINMDDKKNMAGSNTMNSFQFSVGHRWQGLDFLLLR